MRVALIGAIFAHDRERRLAYVAASTRITHTDPKALIGATAIAELAAWIVRDRLECRPAPDAFTALLRSCGSRDGSRALIRGYAGRDSRVMLVEQANAGAHAAINRGLGLARGQFLAILNSDDRFAPQRLARLHEVCAPVSYTHLCQAKIFHLKIWYCQKIVIGIIITRSVI